MTSPNTGTPADPRIEAAREYAEPGEPKRSGGMHPHVLGILLVILGLALISTSDAIAKWTIKDLPTYTVIMAQALGLIVLGGIVAKEPNPAVLIRTPDPRWQIARSVCQLGSGLAFYAGLQVLQFAEVVAILFVGPLIVTAMAHIFLGEHVGPRRWAACWVGLVGGLIIVRPGTDVMGWAAIWPVLAVTFWSIYIVITRKISPRNSTGNMMLWASVVPLLAMAVVVPLTWEVPTIWQWVGLVGIAFLSAASNGVTIHGYGMAPASLLAPFTYLEIVGATLFGWFIWQEFPDVWTWVGAAIIVAAGLYVLRRETRAAKQT
ncbi:MAG: DMT family transporter [Rhodospirillales bacterium]|nr:DMT family transporter [Rhodospirillales bacterium]